MLGPFDTAEAAATVRDSQATDLVVCATYKGNGSGQLAPNAVPVFFLAPTDAEDDYMRNIAFEIKHGRPLSSYENWLLERAADKVAV